MNRHEAARQTALAIQAATQKINNSKPKFGIVVSTDNTTGPFSVLSMGRSVPYDFVSQMAGLGGTPTTFASAPIFMLEGPQPIPLGLSPWSTV